MGGDLEAVRARLLAGLEQLRLALGADQVEQLVSYLSLLQRWNRAYNLTAVRSPLEVVSRHLLDSLSAFPYLFGDRLLDVGTGAGLPGIPIAIAAPERTVCLLDSNGKKTRFLRQAVMELALPNVTVFQARMESYLPERKFATIISRAVNLAPGLPSAMARPARLLVMKGRRPASSELEELDPSPDTLTIHRLVVPYLDAERHLIDARYD